MKGTVLREMFTGLVAVGAVFALRAAGPVNPGLEDGEKGWSVPKPNWSVREGAGRNATKGLVWEGADTNAYQICSCRVPFKPGQKLKISIWIKDEGLVGGEPGFCVEFFNANGYLSGVGSRLAPNQPKDPKEWRLHEAFTGPLPPAATVCSVDLFVRKGVTGRCVYDDVEAETLGFETEGLFYSLAPDDRAHEGKVRLSATTYADRSGYRPEELEAFFTVNTPGGRKKIKTETFEGGLAEAHVDVPELVLGTQRMLFTVKAKNGDTLSETRLAFTRLEKPDAPKVYFDKHRRMIVDGQPVYPLLVYSSNDSELDPRAFPALDKGPIKMVVSYNRYMTPERLDLFRAHGIRVFCGVDAYWRECWCVPVEIGEWWDEAAHTARRVELLKNHPALLGWYLADEPTPAKMPRLRERYKLVRALDPEHPCLNVLCHARQARDTAAVSDIVGLDCYPVPGSGTEKTKPAKLDAAAVAATTAVAGLRGDKPFWFVPQAYPHEPERARFPTAHELGAMTWQAICCGADGVLFYSLGEMLSNKEKPGYHFEEAWSVTCAVAQQIRDREAFLLSTEPAPEVKDLPAGLVARAWRLDGKTLLAVCNTTHQPVSGEMSVGGEKISVSLGGDDVLLK